MEGKQGYLVRHITQQDDFAQLLQMMNDTAKRFNPDPLFGGYGTTTEDLKDNYADPAKNNGFLTEHDGEAVGFMCVSLSPITRNGFIEFGFLEGHEVVLADLVDKCLPVVRHNGGNKLFYFAFSAFGQIRNREISLWESLGFTSGEYSEVTLALYLKEWKEPEDFNKALIIPAAEEEHATIKQLLIEDDESFIAERVDNPKTVVITLRDANTNEIAALAFYFVDIFQQGTEHEYLDAYSFTLHVRPKFQLSKSEIHRLLQAALLSTKQLGVMHVISRITLKNFTVFALMIREGFDDLEMEKNSTVQMYKRV